VSARTAGTIGSRRGPANGEVAVNDPLANASLGGVAGLADRQQLGAPVAVRALCRGQTGNGVAGAGVYVLGGARGARRGRATGVLTFPLREQRLLHARRRH